MKKKLSFTVESFFDGDFTGYCNERPDLKYGPVATRRAAMSGIRRLAGLDKKKKTKTLAAAVRPLKNVGTRKKVNEFAIVIDISGSMYEVRSDLVRSLREQIKTLRDLALTTKQETFVSLFVFSDEVRRIFGHVSVDNVVINDDDFEIDGLTALYDAVTAGANYISAIYFDKNVDVSYIVMTMTDGQENASRSATLRSFQNKIKQLNGTDRWTFTFLLPPGHKDNFVRATGVHAGNCQEWEGTSAGVRMATVSNTRGLSGFYTNRSHGQTCSSNFYTDLSKVTTQQLKTNLIDVRGLVSVLTVKKEEKIREFCERETGKPFLKGAAFYALTKEEKKVQPYKQILIMEKNKGNIYGGADARSILGLPNDRSVKIIPGNHANYDVYVQSTSTNRQLVRGTKVLYYPTIGVPFKEGPSALQALAKRKRKQSK